MARNMDKDRLERARGFINQHQGDSPADLAALMRTAGDTYLEEVSEVSAAEQEYSPGEGEWSILEVCLHVVHAISRVANLVPLLASGTVPDAPTPTPGVLEEDPGDFETVLEQLRGTFDHAVKAASSLEGSPDDTALFEHPFFGPLNCREWMAFNVLHTNVHIAQVQRTKGDYEKAKVGG